MTLKYLEAKIKKYYPQILFSAVFLAGLILSVFRYPMDDESYYLQEAVTMSECLRNFHYFGNEPVGLHGFIFKLPVAFVYLFTGPSVFAATLFNIILAAISISLCYGIFLRVTKSEHLSAAAVLMTMSSYYFVICTPTFLRDMPGLLCVLLFTDAIIKKRSALVLGLLGLLLLDAKEYLFWGVIPPVLLYLAISEISIHGIFKPLSYLKITLKAFLIIFPSALYMVLMFYTSLIPLNITNAAILGLTKHKTMGLCAFSITKATKNFYQGGRKVPQMEVVSYGEFKTTKEAINNINDADNILFIETKINKMLQESRLSSKTIPYFYSQFPLAEFKKLPDASSSFDFLREHDINYVIVDVSYKNNKHYLCSKLPEMLEDGNYSEMFFASDQCSIYRLKCSPLILAASTESEELNKGRGIELAYNFSDEIEKTKSEFTMDAEIQQNLDYFLPNYYTTLLAGFKMAAIENQNPSAFNSTVEMKDEKVKKQAEPINLELKTEHKKNPLMVKLVKWANILLLYLGKFLYPRSFSFLSVPILIVIPAFILSISKTSTWIKENNPFMFISFFMYSFVLFYIFRASHGRYLIHVSPFIFLFFLHGLITKPRIFFIALISSIPFVIGGIIFENEYLLVKIASNFFFVSILILMSLNYLKTKKYAGNCLLLGFVLSYSVFTAGTAILSSYKIGQIGNYFRYGYAGENEKIASYFSKDEKIWFNKSSSVFEFFRREPSDSSEGNAKLLSTVPKKNLIKRYSPLTYNYKIEDLDTFRKKLNEENISKITFLVSTLGDKTFPMQGKLDEIKNADWVELEKEVELKSKILYLFKVK